MNPGSWASGLPSAIGLGPKGFARAMCGQATLCFSASFSPAKIFTSVKIWDGRMGRNITGLSEMPIESRKGHAGQSSGFSRIAGRPARIARSRFVL
ncbi:hypothetical protein EMIT0111MI5_30467 [Burkholderia sp. IT-111MI5]